MFIRAALLLICSVLINFATAQKKGRIQQEPNNPVLFSVNKIPVTAEEFLYLYKKNHSNKQEDFTSGKIEEYLDLFINFKLKVAEAKSRGMDTTQAFAREFNQYRDELRKPYLPDTKLTDSLVQMTYDRLKYEVRAAHVLINVGSDASPEDTLKAYNKIESIRKQIEAGEEFNKVASTLSDDPSAKINGGDLGYFTALQMVYPFENAAYTTPVGQLSKPVRTRFGYHVLKVIDKRPARGEVEVSHIMIRRNGEASEINAKDKIFEVFDQLQAGIKWEELVQQYSEDPSTKNNGGKLKPFGVGMMANAPEFERVAFELEKVGDVSDPVETQYGWHILRLERKIPLAPLAELSGVLKQRVNRDERTQVSKQALQDKLRNNYGLKETQKIKSYLFEAADSTLTKGKWTTKGLAQIQNETLFFISEKNYKVANFLSYVIKNQAPSQLSPQKYLEQLYNNFVETSILEILEKKIADNNPEYKYLLNEYYEGILLFEIMEKEVWNKASADSLGQLDYYKNNGSKYQAGERTKATLFSSSDGELMEEFSEIVKNADQKKIQEYALKNKVKTETGYFAKTDKPLFNLIKWSPGIWTAESNGMYYLAWIKDILQPGTMSFEEARASIVSDYQNYVEKNWVDKLRKKFDVKMNVKAKRYVLQKLQNQ